MPDPGSVTAFDWLQIGKWVTRLWVYFFFIVALSFTFLNAHAIIPSLVASGQIPRSASKLRRPMYATCLLLVAGAIVFMVFSSNQAHFSLDRFWGRFWI